MEFIVQTFEKFLSCLAMVTTLITIYKYCHTDGDEWYKINWSLFLMLSFLFGVFFWFLNLPAVNSLLIVGEIVAIGIHARHPNTLEIQWHKVAYIICAALVVLLITEVPVSEYTKKLIQFNNMMATAAPQPTATVIVSPTHTPTPSPTPTPKSSIAAAGSWKHIGLNNLRVSTLVSDPTNASILFAGTNNGVYKSTDKGNTWTATSNQGIDASVVVVDPTDHNILYATLGDNSTGVQKSTDGGNTWTSITNNMVAHNTILDLAVDPTNANIVYAAAGGQCPGVQKSTDGGSTWSRMGGGCDLYTFSFDPSNSGILYAGGTNFSGYFEKTIDGGSTWTSLNQGLGSPGAVHRIVVDPNNVGTIYVGTEAYGVYKSTDGGTSWNLLSNSPPVQTAGGLAINPLNSNVYAQASTGVAESTDGGSTWIAINTGDTPIGIEKLVVLPNDTSRLYAATDTGVYVYVILHKK